MATVGSTGQAPPEAPMPTRLINSTPPAMTRSWSPAFTAAEAKLTASSPEAQ